MSVYNGIITDSKSYKKTLECILNGVTDPEVLLEQIHRRTLNRVEPDIIKDALIGIVYETGGGGNTAVEDGNRFSKDTQGRIPIEN